MRSTHGKYNTNLFGNTHLRSDWIHSRGSPRPLGAQAMKKFTSGQGAVFAKIVGDTLLKYEKERDRLRACGGRAHGIDERLLDEALSAGVKFLEIREQASDGETRVFRIPLDSIKECGRRLVIAGRTRWSVPLSACELASGQAEAWWEEERRARMAADKRRQEVEAIREEQLTLFSDQEKDYWKTKLLMRWEQSSGSGGR